MSMFENPRAFAPFYEDMIILEGVRAGSAVAVTVFACVLDNGYEEPLTDEGTVSERRQIVAHIPKSGPHRWTCDWQPQIGDKLTNAYGVKFSVYKVDLFDGDDFVLNARQLDG